MKIKLTKEKILLLIIGIALVIALSLLIVYLINNANKDKYKEYYETVETNITENVKNLKAQIDNSYAGTDLIFNEKKFNTKNLSDYEVLSFITNYFYQNAYSEEIDEEVYSKLEEKLSDKGVYIIYTGKTYRDYAKKLLNIDLKNKSVDAKDGQIYNFEYISDADAYIITPTKNYENYEKTLSEAKKDIVVKVDSSRSTSKTVETTIVVAYAEYINSDDNLTIKYYKDKDLKNLVFEINASDLYILDEKGDLIENPDIDTVLKHKKEFTKYVVTSTKNGDNFPITSIKRK